MLAKLVIVSFIQDALDAPLSACILNRLVHGIFDRGWVREFGRVLAPHIWQLHAWLTEMELRADLRLNTHLLGSFAAFLRFDSRLHSLKQVLRLVLSHHFGSEV